MPQAVYRGFGVLGLTLSAFAVGLTSNSGRISPSIALYSFPEIADFDGDHRPDIVFTRPQGLINGSHSYQVEILFSTQADTLFDVESALPGGLHIATRDVDGDSDLDLVITAEIGRDPVGVWINDGHGQFAQGDSARYAGSLWKQTDHDVHPPRTPVRASIPLVLPTAGWSLAPHLHIGMKLARQAPILPLARESRLAGTFGSSSPFRAPPLS